MRISSIQCKTSKLYEASVGIGLHSTLCGYFPRVVEQRRGEDSCRLREQLLLHAFFSLKKLEIMPHFVNRGFVVLPGWKAASALSNEFFTQLKAPSTFPTESLLELFHFNQSTFLAEDALRAEEIRTH